MMIVAAFFDGVYSDYHYRDNLKFEAMYVALQELKTSYLEKGFKGSSTRPKQLENAYDVLIAKYKELIDD